MTSVLPPTVDRMSPELEIVSFPTRADLWAWLDVHAAHHLGVWVQLAKAGSSAPSVTFHDLLEAGIAQRCSDGGFDQLLVGLAGVLAEAGHADADDVNGAHRGWLSRRRVR